MNMTEANRLEAFRQLRQGIRGSGDYLIVGIDIGKDRHHGFFGTATGKALWRRFIFANSRQGFEKLVVQTEALQVQHGLKQAVYGMEPTANYHKPLGEYLIRRGAMVVLVSNGAVKKNRELLYGRWDKNDIRDPANVADLVSQGKCLFYENPPGGLRALRELLSLKRRLKKQQHSQKVRIRNHLLAQYFPELDRYLGRSEGLRIVRWCLDPAQIAAMDYEAFVGLVAPRADIRQHRRLQAIKEQAAHSIGCRLGEAVAFEAQVMVEGLHEVCRAIQATEAKIQDLCLRFPEYSYLLTIPGFGPDVSSKVLGAIGDPHRFRTAKEVLKMTGLDLSANRSGKRTEGWPVISKKGKADLRYALYQAALIASSRNPDFISWFTSKIRGREREKGIKTKMRVKLSAKLVVIAWTLMKKKVPFDPSYVHRK